VSVESGLAGETAEVKTVPAAGIEHDLVGRCGQNLGNPMK
jgi:hypothetical protein